ncbi:MAG: MmgE/PrpD family protein [Thermodesulfobacteriota bacterium]|nr:MmgE/PrpD family protein [Thermodesulfobacteriota bacterium]
MEITKKLAKFCAELRFDQLPAEVVDRAKYFALDFVGVVARGFLEDSTKAMYQFVKGMGPITKGGVIIGTKTRAPHHYAALANGTSSHSLELDDVNNEASLHPGVAIFPAVFAACEMADRNGKRFIEGIVLGYEVMIRLGKALGPKEHYSRGFHPTGTCGTFGATAAAAKIMGLNEAQMVNAFGIAGSQAAGSMEFLAQGAWTKRMHPGWAAHNGIIASLLAKRGFKGPSTIIEGRDGFLHAYSLNADGKKVLDGLGSSFEIMRTSIKPHACCRYMQPPIDGILKIMRENQLKPKEIDEVTLGILKAGFPIIVTPEGLKYNPQSVVDAQFSMPFGAAVAILYGNASLNQYRKKIIQAPEVKEMMKKVRCVEDLELEKVYPRQWPATTAIKTKDGRTFSTKIDYPKGDPENALSWDELIEKFNGLTSSIYSKARRDKFVGQIRKIERLGNLKQWTSILLRDR